MILHATRMVSSVNGYDYKNRRVQVSESLGTGYQSKKKSLDNPNLGKPQLDLKLISSYFPVLLISLSCLFLSFAL